RQQAQRHDHPADEAALVDLANRGLGFRLTDRRVGVLVEEGVELRRQFAGSQGLRAVLGGGVPQAEATTTGRRQRAAALLADTEAGDVAEADHRPGHFAAVTQVEGTFLATHLAQLLQQAGGTAEHALQLAKVVGLLEGLANEAAVTEAVQRGAGLLDGGAEQVTVVDLGGGAVIGTRQLAGQVLGLGPGSDGAGLQAADLAFQATTVSLELALDLGDAGREFTLLRLQQGELLLVGLLQRERRISWRGRCGGCGRRRGILCAGSQRQQRDDGDQKGAGGAHQRAPPSVLAAASGSSNQPWRICLRSASNSASMRAWSAASSSTTKRQPSAARCARPTRPSCVLKYSAMLPRRTTSASTRSRPRLMVWLNRPFSRVRRNSSS